MQRQRLTIMIGVWSLICGTLMGAGSVETMDGKAYRGEVRAEEGAVIVKPEDGGPEVRVLAEQLRHVIFRNALTATALAVTDGGVGKPWTSRDIGGVRVAGRSVCDTSGAVTIKASGWGAWGDADSLHYVWRPLNGDGQITARIVALDPGQYPVSAGVMIRRSVAPDCPMATLCMHTSGELRLSCRGSTALPSRREAIKAAPGTSVRLARRGNIFTASRSADGKTWEEIESVRVAMSAEAMAGLAVWTAGNTSIGQATFDSVAVVEGPVGTSTVAGGIEEGVVLRDGSVWAAPIRSADRTTITIARGGQERSLERSKVAWIILSPTVAERAKLAGKTGVLLADGDFVEGEVTAISITPAASGKTAQARVTVSSVVAGVMELDESRPVAAILVADVAQPATAFRVRMADGSVQQAQSVSLTRSGIVVDGNATTDVVEIERRVTQP